MKVTSIQTLDDIDSTVIAEGTSGGTMQFGLDGTTYDIDLTQEHAAELRELLAPYIAGGRRRVKDGKNSIAPRAASTKSDKAELAAIRAWATEHDIAVSDRGRISQAVREAYEARS
jgi:hypothetical protein